MVDKHIVMAVQDSYGRCLVKGDLFQHFYDLFLASSPLIKARFAHTDFDGQKKLIRHGINLMIMYAANNPAGKSGLARIRDSHNQHKLNIPPMYYAYWKRCLLQAVKDYDPKATADLMEFWNQLLDVGIDFISSGYRGAQAQVA